MRILGIETSCDECSFAIVEHGKDIKGLVVYSQLKEHKEFGGVVPELASRLHVKYIATLYHKLVADMGLTVQDMHSYIDGIAVTICPGLSGALMVGLHYAKGLALSLQKPLIGIDHIQAHFYSAQLEEDIEYPYIGVVISGGHTLLAIVHDYDQIEIKGASLDDACGEVFEKIARELHLGYPGGPVIDTLAKTGDIQAASFPVYRVTQYGYNFSYSGLKTAVLHHRDKYWNKEFPQSPEHISAAFQHAAIQMVIERIEALAKETGISCVCFGGGVACNSYISKLMYTHVIPRAKLTKVVIPSKSICMDNAAMIAGLGYQYLSRGITSNMDIVVSARKHLYRAKASHHKTI